jgi:hypothetical protein
MRRASEESMFMCTAIAQRDLSCRIPLMYATIMTSYHEPTFVFFLLASRMYISSTFPCTSSASDERQRQIAGAN